MKEQKDVLGSIILLFILHNIIGIFIGIFPILVSIFDMNIYTILIGEFLLYCSIIYFVFFRLKSIPKFNIWIILLMFLIYFVPKDFFYVFTIDELKEIAKIDIYERSMKVFFRFTFMLFVCVKYYRIKR